MRWWAVVMVMVMAVGAPQARGRVKELERQLEDQKNIFKRRVQELEARLKVSSVEQLVARLRPHW